MASTNVNDLPQSILSDILSRVSAIWLLQHRRVCKLWLEIIDDQRFRNVNLARGGEKTLFYFHRHKFCLVRLKEGEVELTEVAELNQVKCTDRRGSCNGLVVFDKLYLRRDSLAHQIFVFNPVTKETIAPPEEEPRQDEEGNHSLTWVSYGFGFDSATDTYKMVRIVTYYDFPRTYTTRACVFDLKSRTWRACKFPPPHPASPRGFVFASGAVNWFICRTGTPSSLWKHAVLSFDPSKEEFSLISAPKDVDLGFSLTRPVMLELEGSLALVDYSGRYGSPSPIVVVYVLKDIASREWTAKYRIRTPTCFYDVIGLYGDDKQLLLYDKRKSQNLYLSNCNGEGCQRFGPNSKEFQPSVGELFYITPSFSSMKVLGNE